MQWYADSIYNLHLDFHAGNPRVAVGAKADVAELAARVKLSQPTAVQHHAKGNPGWAMYPTQVGAPHPKLSQDLVALWTKVAEASGCKFMAYFNLGRDRNLCDTNRAYDRVSFDGKYFDNMLCFNSGVLERVLLPQLREIVETYHPAGMWLDGATFTIQACFCDKCKARFASDTGLSVPDGPDHDNWLAYKNFQRQTFRQTIETCAQTIHTADPNCLVAVNWSYSLMMPEQPRHVDWLTGDVGWHPARLSCYARLFSCQGLPFDLMTTVFLPRGRVKPATQMEQGVAISLANGGRYFCWDNPLYDGTLHRARHERLAEVAKFIRARKPYCHRTESVPEVVLLHSAGSLYARTARATQCFCFPATSHGALNVQGASDALNALHLHHDVAPDHVLQRGIDAGLLVLSAQEKLDPATVDAVARYVEQGGTLLATGATDLVTKGSAGSLSDVLGVRVGDLSKRQVLGIEHGDELLVGPECPADIELCGADAVRYALATDGSRVPLLTRHAFGQGAAWHLRAPLFDLCTRDGIDDVLPAIRSVLDQVHPPQARRLTTDAPACVEFSLRSKEGCLLVQMVNTYGLGQWELAEIPAAGPFTVSVRTDAEPRRVVLRPANVALDWTMRDGRVEFGVPRLDLYQVAVIELPGAHGEATSGPLAQTRLAPPTRPAAKPAQPPRTVLDTDKDFARLTFGHAGHADCEFAQDSTQAHVGHTSLKVAIRSREPEKRCWAFATLKLDPEQDWRGHSGISLRVFMPEAWGPVGLCVMVTTAEPEPRRFYLNRLTHVFPGRWQRVQFPFARFRYLGQAVGKKTPGLLLHNVGAVGVGFSQTPLDKPLEFLVDDVRLIPK